MEEDKKVDKPKDQEVKPTDTSKASEAAQAPKADTEPAKPGEPAKDAVKPETAKKEELKKEQPQAVPDKPKSPSKEDSSKPSKDGHLQVNTTKSKGKDLDEREDIDHEDSYQSWEEYRVIGKAPRRRGYHAAFIHNDYLYVHGGHDIREGTLEKLYKINLNPKGNDNEWEQIMQRGVEKPGIYTFLHSYHNL